MKWPRVFRDPAYPRWTANVLMLLVVALALVVSIRDQGAAQRADASAHRADDRVGAFQIQSDCRTQLISEQAAADSVAALYRGDIDAALGDLIVAAVASPRDPAVIQADIELIHQASTALAKANANARLAADRRSRINEICPTGTAP